jgi:predicted small lipoprotein YifL
MKRFIVALATISIVMLSAGCGQSGPLYLPGDPSKIEEVPPAPADAEEEKEENGDSAKQQS